MKTKIKPVYKLFAVKHSKWIKPLVVEAVSIEIVKQYFCGKEDNNNYSFAQLEADSIIKGQTIMRIS